MAKPITKRGRPSKPIRYARRTFMFDARTDEEVVHIQRTLRATTASEAMRYAVRKILELMTYAGQGAKLRAEFANKKNAMLLDIPPFDPEP